MQVEMEVIQDIRFSGELGRAMAKGEQDDEAPSAALNYLAWRRSAMTYAFNAIVLCIVFNLLGALTTEAASAVIQTPADVFSLAPPPPPAFPPPAMPPGATSADARAALFGMILDLVTSGFKFISLGCLLYAACNYTNVKKSRTAMLVCLACVNLPQVY